MPATGHVHVEIDFACGVEPVTGRLTSSVEEVAREFSGWMELVAALDCARGGRRTSLEDISGEETGDQR